MPDPSDLVGLVNGSATSRNDYCSSPDLGDRDDLAATRIDLYFVRNPADVVVDGDEYAFQITVEVGGGDD